MRQVRRKGCFGPCRGRSAQQEFSPSPFMSEKQIDERREHPPVRYRRALSYAECRKWKQESGLTHAPFSRGSSHGECGKAQQTEARIASA